MDSEDWRDWKHSTWKMPIPVSLVPTLGNGVMEISLGYLASALRCALKRDIGIDRTLDVMMLGAALLRGDYHAEDVRSIMREMLVKMVDIARSEDELALVYTYSLLRERTPDGKHTLIDRATAAVIASDIRGKPVTTDAWRVYLDEWVRKRELPKVGIRKRATTNRVLTKK